MKKYLIVLSLILIQFSSLFAQDYGNSPKNLKECMVALDEYFSKTDQYNFVRHTEEDLAHAYNLSVGAYIRSHWGLNDEESELYGFFEERGITEPHDMSNIILISYHRVSKKQFINLEQQIEDYIGEKQLHKVKKKLKKAGKEI